MPTKTFTSQLAHYFTEEGIPSIADSLFGQLYLISSFGSSSSSSSFFLLFDTRTELGVLAADDYSLKKSDRKYW